MGAAAYPRKRWIDGPAQAEFMQGQLPDGKPGRGEHRNA
jgi:hypothetical protein